MTDAAPARRTAADERLRRIRGAPPPRPHNARTIAALTGNPGCTRRAVVDAAGVDKERLARRVGQPAPFGQSRFAITRGHAFEARVKADGCVELLRLLGELFGADLAGTGYADLAAAPGTAAEPGGEASAAWPADAGDPRAARHAYARTVLAAATSRPGGALYDHPLLRLDIAGRPVYLEPDLVAFQHAGAFRIIEIKSFPVIDGRADGAAVAAAATQAAVYVLALRRMLGRTEAVADEVVLVCPRDFSNTPVAVPLDVRRQLIVLEHQLARLARVDALLEALPAELSLDLSGDAAGRPVRSPDALAAGLRRMPARYAPDCLARCELAYFCRDEAAGRTAALGPGVREALGGVDSVAEALSLAHGTLAPGPDQAEAAARLRTAARRYAEALRVSGTGVHQ